MNEFQELRLNVEALYNAVNEDKKSFSPIYDYIKKMHESITIKADTANKDELKFFAQKIEEFFSQYRPSKDSTYFPPSQIYINDANVQEILRLSLELDSLSQESFEVFKFRLSPFFPLQPGT